MNKIAIEIFTDRRTYTVRISVNDKSVVDFGPYQTLEAARAQADHLADGVVRLEETLLEKIKLPPSDPTQIPDWLR